MVNSFRDYNLQKIEQNALDSPLTSRTYIIYDMNEDISLTENELSVKINGISLRYTEHVRPSGSPVIFIHGFPFCKAMWSNQITALRASYHIVAFDIRGHGNSEEGNDSFSIDLFVSDLLGLMDHLKIEKAILCGLSLGGYISLNAISKFPDRFKALVLSDTQCIADTPEVRDKRMKAIESIKNGELEKYADDSVKNLFAPGSFISRCREIADVRQMILNTSASSLCKTLIALAERKETCTTLKDIRVPVLIMAGAEDKITPPAAALQLNESINGSSIHIIEKAGHMSNMENPAKFNEHLLNFLATVG